MRRVYSIFVVGLCSVLWLLGSATAATLSPYSVERLIGQKAPGFSLKDIEGKPVTLSAYKGRVVLLNFWAAWCPPCRAEMPSMEKLNRRLKDKGLVVLAVSVDRSLSPVRDFLKNTPVSFPVLADDDKQQVARSLYKVFTIPTTFIIDRNGVVVDRYFGEQDWTKPETIKKIEALF